MYSYSWSNTLEIIMTDGFHSQFLRLLHPLCYWRNKTSEQIKKISLLTYINVFFIPEIGAFRGLVHRSMRIPEEAIWREGMNEMGQFVNGIHGTSLQNT